MNQADGYVESVEWTDGYNRGREEALHEVYMWLDSNPSGITLARLLEDFENEFKGGV